MTTFQEAYERVARAVPDRVSVGASRLAGEVRAPASKSYTHRAIMVAGLGEGGRVRDPLLCTDTAGTAAVWEALGAALAYDEERRLLEVRGFDGRPRLSSGRLYVHEAGTLLRLLLPGVALCEGEVVVEGNASFARRANDVIVGPLRDLGVDVSGLGPEHRAPITVHARGCLPPGRARVPGGKSSQSVSALLLWLPLAEDPAAPDAVSEIVIDGEPVSRPYVRMTEEMLAWAGIRFEHPSERCWRVPSGQRYRVPAEPFAVPGDYSSAAFLLAAAAVAAAGPVMVTGLAPDDAQGDRRIVDVLEAMGADVTRLADGVRVGPARPLAGVAVDCADTPDLVPILATLGALASGETRLENLKHLRNKESDRIAAPVAELSKLGVDVREQPEALVIRGGGVGAGCVDAHNDHRIAMALAVAGLVAGGVEVTGFRSVLKSYPTFLGDLAALGGDVGASAGVTADAPSDG